MPLIGILSRHESVIRAAILRDCTLLHLDADTLNRQPLYTQTYQGVVRHKEGRHYWVECSFGSGLLPQEKHFPPLNVGQSVTVQISRESFFDTAEKGFKSPILTRRIIQELSLWEQLLPLFNNLELLLVDNAEVMISLRAYCKTAHPTLALKLVSHNLFEEYGLEDSWALLECPIVDFPGGNLIIETTAAATIIDINGIGKTESLNLQAAEILGQQITWRTLSGSILIEFIDHGQGHRPQLIEKLTQGLTYFNDGITIHGFSKLGFLELSRVKRRSPLHHRKVFNL
ncbi:ribonuclease E/G [Candidatus Odyssella thessalonicensis]|uniref:ribonuclease E/G n=1 Tax=Candidatus Odyssella thessalonicensis TaxID=84647 RepID=UPI000225A937|nr:ribonuclease E/G [Candidatus Odyssella thessalonicensis]